MNLMAPPSDEEVNVTVVVPVYNAANWIEECLQSVKKQTFSGNMELSVYDDASQDETPSLLKSFIGTCNRSNLSVVHSTNTSGSPKGVGFAKNRAVEQSSGKFLCFLDADDIMLPERIQKQFEAATNHPDAIIGSRFERIPVSATERYSSWANGLQPPQLYSQVYLSHGPTLIMPTWFCHRNVFDRIGGFSEEGKGTPEDLIFFYKHLDYGGRLHRVDDVLLLYRHHLSATTFSISEDTIWNLRTRRLESEVLSKWSSFTIWNAGKQGRKLYRTLQEEYRNKVVAFCDVDSKKIATGFYTFEESKERPKPKIPIVHFSDAQAPFIICVKLGLTNGKFEENLDSLNLREGQDYFHFN